ncbi:hypothetical protein K492DRAFT_185097 [Lichtheimia hyalospora FSU 10163]|nr:hypothetical protein K492DRAFT_185097 [Lichtheimia hyalospora FSU 10163]
MNSIIPNRNIVDITRLEVHPRADCKKILSKELKENGVYWVVKEGKEPQASEAPQPLSKRSKIWWNIRYRCHRAGTPYERSDRVKGGSSDKPREYLKDVKPCGCKATLDVVCYYKTSASITFIWKKEHTGHTPNTAEDIQFLPRPGGGIATTNL